MRRLRSPWALLVLAPVFFLVGFGIVSAFAGGSDEPGPAALRAGATVPASTPTVAESATDAAPAPPEASTEVATTSESTTTGPTATTPGSDLEIEDAVGSAVPPPGTVAVDYGRWKNVFRVAGARMVKAFGASTVAGELRYVGDAGCRVKRVEIEGRFYDSGGTAVGEALWRSNWTTGAAPIEPGAALPLEAYGLVFHDPASASIRITRVVCG